MKLIHIIPVTAGALIFGQIALAQTPPQATSPSKTSPAPVAKTHDPGPDELSDADMLSRMHTANLAEIDFSNEVRGRAQDRRTRDFAQQMIKEHTANDQRVMNLVRDLRLNLTSVRPLDREERVDLRGDRAVRRKLEGLKGLDIDRAYLRQMADDHNDLIHQLGPDRTKNARVKDLVNDTIPVAKRHHQHAIALLKDLEGKPSS